MAASTINILIICITIVLFSAMGMKDKDDKP